MNTKDFIEKAYSKHGNAYEYSKVVYVNSRTKVNIVCKIHGDFMQQPQQHLVGKGCHSCGVIKRANSHRYSQDTFIRKATKVHNGVYMYDNVIYTSSIDCVSITCKLHGDFLQAPKDHLIGNGCKQCGLLRMGNTFRTSLEAFISKACVVHNNKYSYEGIQFKALKDKIAITCSTHGTFMQTGASHLNGHGCPKCNNSRFNKEKPASVYLVYLDDLQLYKVGITNSEISSRLHKESYTLIDSLKFDLGYDALITEQMFIRDNRMNLYKGTKVLKNGGDTELFTEINRKLSVGTDDHGKQMKPTNFVGPEEKLQVILDKRES